MNDFMGFSNGKYAVKKMIGYNHSIEIPCIHEQSNFFKFMQ
jgi:hypothetical protein